MAADTGRKKQIENGTRDENIQNINKASSQDKESIVLEGDAVWRRGAWRRKE